MVNFFAGLIWKRSQISSPFMEKDRGQPVFNQKQKKNI